MLFLLISTTYTDSEIFNISKVTIAENSPLDEVHNAASPATEFSIQNTPFYIFRTDFNFRKVLTGSGKFHQIYLPISRIEDVRY